MANDSETEDRILEAARTVFLRRGTAGARMQEIADEAGVNKALLHYYFRSKDRLAEAVFRRAAKDLFPSVLRILKSEEMSLEQKVEGVVTTELDVLSRTPILPGYVVSELHHHPERTRQLVEGIAGVALSEEFPRAVSVLRRQLETAAEAGEIRAIGAEQFIVNLLSLCIFPFVARPVLGDALGVDGERFEAFLEERKRELPGFILRGLRP
jgi:TetR/AcrR family transcriptional regulator